MTREKEMIALADKVRDYQFADRKTPLVFIAHERRLIEDALRKAATALPDEPTAMMALRGAQAGDAFDKDDLVQDYFDFTDVPKSFEPQHRFDDDERPWILAAAIYRGAVHGHQECLRRLAEDPTDAVALGWSKPFTSTLLGRKQKSDG